MSDINQQITEQVNSHPIFLYMKGTPDFPQCGFSGKVVQILREAGADFKSFNVFDDEAIRQGIKAYANWPTIPQLYINGEFVGGCDIVIEMFENGQLSELIKS